MKRTLHCAALFGLVLAAGCGGGEMELTDEHKIHAVVAGIGDVSNDPEALKAVFVSGPEKPEDYKNINVTAESEPEVDGDTATVTVKVTTGVVDSSQGDAETPAKQETFEKEWSLEKVDGQWKLKSAPVTP